jgi:hypothetical protein
VCGEYNHFRLATAQSTDIKQNNTVDIANHSAAFTWRFHDDEHEQQSETGSDPSQLIAGVKSEKAAFRAFKMCYVNGNRKGDNGVTIAIGFHQKWIEDQRRQGSRIELIDVYCDALKFCADNNADLHKLSLADLQKAIMK